MLTMQVHRHLEKLHRPRLLGMTGVQIGVGNLYRSIVTVKASGLAKCSCPNLPAITAIFF